MNQKILQIIKDCKIINLKEHEPFPEGKCYLVGLTNQNWGNDCYDVRHFICGLKYSDHNSRLNTYGGYTDIDKDGNARGWWTMNYVYGDEFNRDYAFIVNSYEDGHILAEELNKCQGDFRNIVSSIHQKYEKIEKIEREIKDLELLQTILNAKFDGIR